MIRTFLLLAISAWTWCLDKEWASRKIWIDPYITFCREAAFNETVFSQFKRDLRCGLKSWQPPSILSSMKFTTLETHMFETPPAFPLQVPTRIGARHTRAWPDLPLSRFQKYSLDASSSNAGSISWKRYCWRGISCPVSDTFFGVLLLTREIYFLMPPRYGRFGWLSPSTARYMWQASHL